MFHFLKLIYIKGKLSKKDIKKKRRLKEHRLNELLEFAKNKGYIRAVLGNELKYYLTQNGIEYLLQIKKLRQEESSKEWIKWATIILAISAIISIVDLFLEKPKTKDLIVKWLTTSIGNLINSILQIGLLLIIIIILFKFFSCIKDYYKRRKTRKNKPYPSSNI